MTELGRCKDCRYSNPNHDQRNHPTLLSCESPKLGRGYGPIEVAPDGLIVENDEGWGLLVGPEFGCIHFARRATQG